MGNVIGVDIDSQASQKVDLEIKIGTGFFGSLVFSVVMKYCKINCLHKFFTGASEGNGHI